MKKHLEKKCPDFSDKKKLEIQEKGTLNLSKITKVLSRDFDIESVKNNHNEFSKIVKLIYDKSAKNIINTHKERITNNIEPIKLDDDLIFNVTKKDIDEETQRTLNLRKMVKLVSKLYNLQASKDDHDEYSKLVIEIYKESEQRIIENHKHMMDNTIYHVDTTNTIPINVKPSIETTNIHRSKKQPIINIPKLECAHRNREYEMYSKQEKAKLLKAFLFAGSTHRQLDKIILKLDSHETKGFESMNILHYFGLRKDFKNLFNQFTVEESINILSKNHQDFSLIISYLKLLIIDKNKNNLTKIIAISKQNDNISTTKEQIKRYEAETTQYDETLDVDIITNEEEYQEEFIKKVHEDIEQLDSEKQKEVIEEIVVVRKKSTTKKDKELRDKIKNYLYDTYKGHCQVCGFTFRKVGDGKNSFEMFNWNDKRVVKQKKSFVTTADSLCLCRNCSANVKWGAFEPTFINKFNSIENLVNKSTDEIKKLVCVKLEDKIVDKFRDDYEWDDMYALEITVNDKPKHIYVTNGHLIQFITYLQLEK